MFDICEFCKVNKGSRQKRLPFGLEAGKSLVILRGGETLDEIRQEIVTDCFPEAYVVYEWACSNVAELELAKLGCGILIRNIIANYKVIVLPKDLTEKFFGEKMDSAIVEYKTGQFVIPYTGKPTDVTVTREYERAITQ